jgi:peptidoglycan hydrolase-like protein with peptidoglycan-binding domain
MIKLGQTGETVRWIQQAINSFILAPHGHVTVDGVFGPATERAVRLFQSSVGLTADGVVGPATIEALQGADAPPQRLRQSDLSGAAKYLGIPLAMMTAIVSIESRGNGFLPSGRCVILFERHVFHRRLSRLNVRAQGPENILSPTPGGYLGGEREWERMAQAQRIHRAAALESASYGLFQIMGFHWSRLGYEGVEDYVDLMQESEREHLDAFVRFVNTDRDLHRAMRDADFEKIARIYNGPNYAAHDYHGRLRRAYERALQ